eukprot:scaffold35922_cov65-Phaeocystis_antarctica.AAC.4
MVRSNRALSLNRLVRKRLVFQWPGPRLSTMARSACGTCKPNGLKHESCDAKKMCRAAVSRMSLPRGHREGDDEAVRVLSIVHKRRRLKQSEQHRDFARDLAQL